MPSKRGRWPLRALTAFAFTALVVAVAWYAWRTASGGGRPAAPPPPAIPYNRLVTAPAPVTAPAIDLPTADGKRFSLAAARGQVVVVNFWATWCPPCAEEIPSLVKLGQELAQRHPGKFRIVAVSVDEQPSAVQRFFATPAFGGVPSDVVVALDPGAGEVTRAYPCRGRGACRPEDVRLPETYVVDREGRIVAMVVGYIDWSTSAARLYLEALVAG